MPSAFELLVALARLLTTFADASASTSDRAAALRAAARVAKRTAVTVDLDGDRVTVDSAPLPANAIGHDAIAAALRGHGIRRLVVRHQASARDLAHLVGLLARPAGAGPGAGVALARELDELRLWSVRLVPEEADADGPSLPAAVKSALDALRSSPAAARDNAVRALIAAIAAAAAAEPTQRGRIVATALARALDAADESTRALLRTHAATAAVLIALADAVVSTDAATRQDGLAVFHEAGAVGPRGLVALLASADTMRQRRRCFDALLAIGDGVPALIQALGHPQWYVVRNVAQLLGELRAQGAIGALGRALAHSDARVRESVAVALDLIDVPQSRATLRAAVADDSIEVRRIAARAFCTEELVAEQSPVVARLLAAFDREQDQDVLLEQVRALGHVGTPHAVQRLLRAVGVSNPTPVRLAALDALVRARGPAALVTLRALRTDRDEAVRDVARRLEAVA